ncbi:MAG: hypothetical protein HQL52_17380 [Magnetococcales bacterium]|nr:hypothetical protein [Magnetococcales bacterium]
MRNAISLGGDADTQAAIAGAITETYYGGLPEPIHTETLSRLEESLHRVVLAFRTRFIPQD